MQIYENFISMKYRYMRGGGVKFDLDLYFFRRLQALYATETIFIFLSIVLALQYVWFDSLVISRFQQQRTLANCTSKIALHLGLWC
jgi:hypothetical protein